jgi:tRNA (mo5U34)-methyltransferase
VSTDRIPIDELVLRADAFHHRLADLKARLAPAFPWYPYDSLGSFYELAKLLTGEWRYLLDLAAGDRVLDLCSADGDVAFFLESLGCRVTAVDLASTNFNRMAGLRALKEALASPLEIREMDLNAAFPLEGRYGLAIFLGGLYHLKNPFHVLETLAAHTRYAVISTRIARFTPGGALDMRDAPLAYLVDGRETNFDTTNFWIFSEAGLRRLLARTNWGICRFLTLGNVESSDPASSAGDERAFCLVRSRSVRHEAHLLRGWHTPEPDGWRWTERCFTAAFHDCAAPARTHLRLNFALPETVLDTLGPLTLAAHAAGHSLDSETYSTPGEHLYQAKLSADVLAAEPLVIEFELDKAILPSANDRRELGVVVISVELD